MHRAGLSLLLFGLLLPGLALAADLQPVADLLTALPAQVQRTGTPPADTVEARLPAPAAGVRLLVTRRPVDGQARGGRLLPSLLVLTDPRTPPAEAQAVVDRALQRLTEHDHGQYRLVPTQDAGRGTSGRRDPGGPPTPGLLPLTWTLLLLGLLALPLALLSAGRTVRALGRTPAAWTLVVLIAGLGLRLLAPHRLVMVHFGWLLIDQSAELQDLPRYGPAGPLLYHALFQVFGADAVVVQGLHAVLGTLTLLPLAALVARSVPRPWAAPLVAGLGAVLPLLVLDHTSESLLVPALLWWLAAAVLAEEALDRGGVLRWSAAGVLLALCGLCRPDTMALALPTLGLWLGLRRGVRALWTPALGLLVVAVVAAWLPGAQFLVERAREDVAQGNLPRFGPGFVLALPRLLAEHWVVLHARYFPLLLTGFALLGLALPTVRRHVAGLWLLALAWALPMLLDFNETSMLRLHAPSALFVAAAAGLAVGAAVERAGGALTRPVGLVALVAGPIAAMVGLVVAAGVLWTVPAVFARQNSDTEETLYRRVAAHARDGRPATYVTRGFDDLPDRGIHLVQPRHLLEPHDRWLSVHHFARNPEAAFARGPVYFLRSVRCYAHDRRGPAAPPPTWIHPACQTVCARFACQPVFQGAEPNLGERGFAWYPPADQLPSLAVGLWAVSAPESGVR